MPDHRFTWINSGFELLESMLAAIAEAKMSIRMETYIYTDEEIGRRFKQALIDAGRRGVKVKLLVDAIGGSKLSSSYFKQLDEIEGCHMKWFNRPSLATWSFRDHRKILLIDQCVTYVGGCNIAEEYHGDGINHGWRDGGARVDGNLAEEMAIEFERMWEAAAAKQWMHQAKLSIEERKKERQRTDAVVRPIFVRPGLGQSPLIDAVSRDLRKAKDVAVVSAYFLPGRSFRRQLGGAVSRGARVRLLLGGKSDVWLMQWATRSLYSRLLDAKIEIHEYMLQILHSKILILDDIVYVGSSNLDPRSLRINFEVMLRIHDPAFAKAAWAAFDDDLTRSQEVTPESHWSENWLIKLKQKCAHWLLGRVDPRMAEGMLRRLENRA
jgi:cardiolipin synthase